MQIDAIVETLQHVFTLPTVLAVFCVLVVVVLIAGGILLAHIKRCDPVQGSMRPFTILYCTVTGIFLLIVFVLGVTL